MGHGARIFEKRGQAAVACSRLQVRHGGFGVREESRDRLAHSRFACLVEHPSRDVQAARLQPRRHVGFGVPELERLQLAAHVRDPVRGGLGIAIRGREARLGDLVVASARLEVADDRGVERREHRGDALEGDAARFEDRASWRLAEPGGGAVDVELPAVGRDRSSFEHDLVGADRLHVPESYDVLDRAQQLELGDGDRRAVVHRGRDLLVEAQQLVGGFEPGEQVVDARRPPPTLRRSATPRRSCRSRARAAGGARGSTSTRRGPAPTGCGRGRPRARAARCTRRSPSCRRR